MRRNRPEITEQDHRETVRRIHRYITAEDRMRLGCAQFAGIGFLSLFLLILLARYLHHLQTGRPMFTH